MSILLSLALRMHCLVLPCIRTSSHHFQPLLYAVIDNESSDLNDEISSSIKLDVYMSQPMQLYIEDTDSYQVKYNGNYIRSYERALFQLSREMKDENSILKNIDFITVGVTNHKFKSSPRLGDKFFVTAKFINQKSCVQEEWQLEMIDYNSYDPQRTSERTVYNTATVTVAKKSSITSQLLSKSVRENFISSLQPTSPTLIHTDAFYLHRDEFDSHIPNNLCIRTALNLFERTRSNALGGPDLLQKMQESGLLWVVTSIDDMITNPEITCRPGEHLICDSIFEMKRKGMIIECKQQIRKLSDGIVICAQGIVTLCAVDSKTGKPTKNIPEFVKALFH